MTPSINTNASISTWRRRALPAIVRYLEQTDAPQRPQRAKRSRPMPMYRGKS